MIFELMENPYISVIIVAYTRKNYIKQAIESVLNQTLNQNLYEIIVVKNFEDMEIDDFINKNNIKNIYTVDQRYGEKLTIGIKKSKGNIISFLEDDDIYDKKRLKHIYDIFHNYKIQYYRNSYYYVDKNNGKIQGNEMYNFDKQLYFNKSFEVPIGIISHIVNLSGVSITKNLINKYLSILAKLYITADRFINEIPYLEDIAIFYDSEKLTYYRLHDSSTHIKNNTIKQYTNRQIMITEMALSDHKLLTEFEKNTKMYELMYYYLLILQNHLYLIKKGVKRPKFKEYSYLSSHAHTFKLHFDYFEILMGFLGIFGFRVRRRMLYIFNNILSNRY